MQYLSMGMVTLSLAHWAGPNMVHALALPFLESVAMELMNDLPFLLFLLLSSLIFTAVFPLLLSVAKVSVLSMFIKLEPVLYEHTENIYTNISKPGKLVKTIDVTKHLFLLVVEFLTGFY